MLFFFFFFVLSGNLYSVEGSGKIDLQITIALSVAPGEASEGNGGAIERGVGRPLWEGGV